MRQKSGLHRFRPLFPDLRGVCAAAGIEVDVFEALHEPGGVLIYGIPAFRLPKNVVATEINGLSQAGVDFHMNYVGGRTLDVAELRKEYDAVFIGVARACRSFWACPAKTWWAYSRPTNTSPREPGPGLRFPQAGHPGLPR